MFKRLQVKIIVSLALILTAMIAVYGWWIGSRQTSVYVRTLSENLLVLSRSQADNAAHYIVTQEFAGLETFMVDVAHLPEVLNIMVLERDGRVLCNVERASGGDQVTLNYKIREVAVPAGSSAIMERQENRLVAWSPIVAGTHLGWVKMTLSLDTADKLLRATWQSTLQIGALWILVGTLLMIFVVKRPLGAVRELGRFAHELQHRKGSQVVVKRGVDEIDMLADALNHSSRELLLAEQRLIAEQERLSVTLQSIGDGVIATDTTGRIVLVNQVAELLTGWSQVNALGRDLNEVFSLPDSRLETEESLNAVVAERRTIELAGQHRLVSCDGAERTVTVNSAPIIDSGGELAGMVLVIRDISEKAEMEAEKRGLAGQLAQSQKMEAIGQLAGGVAHDFNNMLGVIIGHAELALMTMDQSSPLKDRLKEILDAANRSADITRQLLAFSRQQHAEPKVLDLNDTISRMLKMLHRLIGEDIDLGWSPGFHLSKVKLDPSQLDQIMANLCVNARDAIAGVGKIEIRTENVTFTHHDLIKQPDTVPGDYVRLVVSDSGCGMSKEVQERIFEPFFTTKELGRGTGLGLATVFGIVKQNNGNIEVLSEPGRGTTFRICLPAVKESTEEMDYASEEPVGGVETILLVEDEPAINILSSTMLSNLGYKVISAYSPEEAIELADGCDMKIDLLLTDIIMPGMNGRDMSVQLLSTHPDMKCLFMSGYTADIIAERGKIGEDVCFLQKPFTTKALAAKVREALLVSI
ncbi:MAG TPA: hybrid sensor histidine kinase/response regulator [Geobacter sp.]|nr:hybrid sensor histidine kinase/response regulator [Geobacter sp.]